jgi:prolyl oligopeptidase
MSQRICFVRRLGTIALLLALTSALAAIGSAGGEKGDRQAASTVGGQRVFTCGHSFHVFVPGILSDIAKKAGIKDHEAVGLSSIGGSRVIQHWNVPDEKNKAKEALKAGKVDVLTLAPIYLPDEGIENFVKLAVDNNPKVRVTVQEFWLPYDVYDTANPLKGRKVDHNAATGSELRKLHEPYFKSIDDHVRELHKKLGKEAVYVVPVGQAVIALREKIIAGEAPGLKTQDDLFTDPIGHVRAPVQALAAYCHFAVIYRRSPVGLPMPAVLAKANSDEKLNHLLQELAWDAVTHHPLSGVRLASGTTGGQSSQSSDPYLWLEDVTGDKALAWVKERNAESTAELTKGKAFAELNDRLLKILDSDERIPMVAKAGPHFYNFWRDAKNKRGLWRRTTLEEYRKAKPQWETVLDLDALAEAEKENWVWKGASFLKPSYERCLLSLSRGGADATVVREFDPRTKSFVKDGFTLPEAKSSVAWRDLDSVFVGTDFGPGSLTTSGYPRLVKEWKRGTPVTEARLVLEGKPEDVVVGAFRDNAKGYERDFVLRAVTFYKRALFVRRDGKLIKIDVPEDATTAVHRDHLFIRLKTEWNVNGRTYPAGALLATDFEAFLAGKRQLDVLFEPAERKSLSSFSPTANQLILNELDNVRNRLYVLTRKDGAWHRADLPGAPKFSTASASAIDPDESDDYFMTVSDYLTPSTLYLGTVGKGPAEKIKTTPAFFDSKGLAVSQHEVISKDGTAIPYFEVAREDLSLSGKNPTLLYGYGGFEIPMLPAYQAGTGAAWLEKGGVYVVANIRGGGEFGPKWHLAALKANRPRAYEDFIAVAEDLIRRKVTSPKHLGVMGGSNGGLLVGNMLTMRPDLFGAVVCQVPLLDMQRYHKLLAGASWMAEYGNPDVPSEWQFIRTFSPYHNLKTSTKYPRTLFTTSTRDDRVHPGHARKMVAKMKDMGHDVVYYENIEGGHGGAADNKQAAFMSALAYTFLWKELK